MTYKYCSSCGIEVILSMRICPACGNRNFSDTSQSQAHNSIKGSSIPNISGDSNNSVSLNQNPPQQVTHPQKKSWSWDWLWQAIAISLIVRFFGPAGGLTAVVVYFWQQPKIGKWPALGVAAVAGIVVPLLILALIRN